MWQAGLLLACLIHCVHTTSYPRCPVLNPTDRCSSYIKSDNCQTDSNCYGGKVCCPQKCGKDCVNPIKQKPKLGICPAVDEKPLEFCQRARVSSNCNGNDGDCKGSAKCCPDICGSRNCKEPISGPRPGCPAIRKPEPQCFHFNQQCSHDKECQKGKICCGVICGTACVYPTKPNPTKPRYGVCPAVPKVLPEICTRSLVVSNCKVDTDCKSRNQKCCRKPCGNFACTDPIQGNRPGCPVCLGTQATTDCPVCVHYQQLCNADTECKPGQKCCYNPSCGTSCKGHVCPKIVCPTIKCGLGFQKDENGCEICKCRQDPCPIFAPLPPWLCSDGKPKIFYVDGVKCVGSPTVIPCNKDCRLPKLPGPCKASFPRYYFNLETGKCDKFIYGGCQGNANNFELLTECQDKCIDREKPTTKPGKCPPNKPGLICPAVVRPGDCFNDGNCPGKQKCCQQGCSRSCVNPGTYYGPKCPPLCEIFCAFGNVVVNGCPICKCKTGCRNNANPLPSVRCSSDKPRCPSKHQCKIAENGVGVCCPYECPVYKCKSCPYGYVIDGNGCQTCTCKPRCPPVCLIFCPFGNVMDANNCPTCACKTGCIGNVKPLSVSCGPGQSRCPGTYQCITPSAGGKGVCCPYHDDVPSCKIGQPLANYFCGRGPNRKDCPKDYFCNIHPTDKYAVCCKKEPRCPPVCLIFCPFGNIMDENNCPTCKCKTGCAGNVNPLTSVSCGSGQQRCPARYQCKTPSGGGGGVCCPYECPLVKCSEPCPYGFVIDVNGCQTCRCKLKCGPVCAIYCPFGNVPDEKGCPTCACKTGCAGNVKPLSSVKCGTGGQKCPAAYQCNSPPHGDPGVCCPYVCPQIKCSRQCPYGYKHTVNGCQTCQCLLACEKGTPQGTCKIGPFPSTPCPSLTYCKNEVCCKIPCKFGDPHPSLSCGMVVGSNKCPAGYSCLGGPADEYFACCPDENKPTPNKCPRDRYPKSRCYARRSCRNDSSCRGNKKCCKQGCRYKCVNPVY
ncbi:cysteine-rich motor neuron 1 protein-like isoform X1 [Mytilus trossulus]|uniref:cysteine-rich motor neuron 1 protein-like isoform X1 n=1 Tax=Mytilus trossulus TaxID=6551 RepID=UPI00300484EA